MISKRGAHSMNPKYLFVFFLMASLLSKAQTGGENTYEFLNLTNSARMAALGGNQVALADKTDLNVAYNNPALLTEEMQNHLATNYVNYISDINYGYVAYSRPMGLPGNLAIGMHYINYGTFTEALPNGIRTGNTFQAAEYALTILWSYRILEQVSAGVNLKPVWSSFETYQSAGLAADIGLAWQSKDELATVGLVLKNIGTQITTYYDDAQREPLPFDVQIGYCQRLAHAPVRLAATLQHLQRWRLDKSPATNSSFSATVAEEEGLGKQFLRHLVLGVELLPSENFTLRFGYNYQRRQELKFNEKMSTVGLSFGLGFVISRFHLNYGVARYHLGGVSNHLSLAINLNDDFRRK